MTNTDKLLRDFIIESFLFGQDDGTFTTEDSLLEKGIVDSTGILEVVEFVENKFDLRVEDDELVPEHFDSIALMRSFIESKLATQSPSS